MNLSCLQHGADKRYIKLHAQTQRQLKYFIKHAYGISTAYNQYSEEHPWHGAGQGTGDAGPRWIVQSHLLMQLDPVSMELQQPLRQPHATDSTGSPIVPHHCTGPHQQ